LNFYRQSVVLILNMFEDFMASANLWPAGILLLLAVSLAPASARAQQSGCDPRDATDDRRAAQLVEFYAAHARPIPGPEQRLGDGTGWRVVVDSVTGMAEPRITTMIDDTPLQRINRILTALQACSILDYYGKAASYYAFAKEAESSFVSHGYVSQPVDRIVLSYVSSTLVSGFGVDIVANPGFGSRPDNRPNGWVIDLARNRLDFSTGCDRDLSAVTGSMGISLGDLIAICSDDEQLAFHALWEKHAVVARARAEAQQQALCRPDPADDRPDNRFFTLHLAPGGLAVFTAYIWPHYLRQCMLEKSADNPVIIPWRELEPFLKPGPWRDELLRQAPS
jgi:hypothetical protein